MKQLYKQTLLWCCLLLTTGVANAQIDSIVVYPSVPTASDSIKLIVYTTFGSGSCSQTGYNVTVSTPIRVEACHENGALAVICNNVDTVNIGVLTDGAYNLDYVIRRENNASLPPSCNGSVVLDSTQINFMVDPVGINEDLGLVPSVKMYPNPSDGKVQLQLLGLAGNGLKLSVCNIVGQQVKSLKLENGLRSFEFDFSDLQPGTYLYQLADQEGHMGTTQKLVIY